MWQELVVQIISKSKTTHELGEIKSTHDWFQNTSTHEVWYQKESNQHNKWSIRHQLKIRYQLGEIYQEENNTWPKSSKEG